MDAECNQVDNAAVDQTVDPVLVQDWSSEPEPVALQLGARPGAVLQQNAPMRVQAKALYRKSAMYQARNVSTNVCIISAPVLFCILLLCLQAGVKKMLSGKEFECGCQCTKCCYEGNSSNCTSMNNSVCPHTCLAHNNSNCGVQYSVGTQVAFCSIPHPSAWPAIVQTPRERERAAFNSPKVTMLYTPGLNATFSDQLSAGLLQQPVMKASTLLAAQQYITSSAKSMPATVPGEAFAMLGLNRLGSSSVMLQQAGLYLETALAGATKSLYMLWPEGTCQQLGLQGAVNSSLSTVLQAMVNASNTPIAAAFLNSRISSLGNITGDGDSALPAAQVASITINCTDVVMTKAPSSKQMQRVLYCGNRLAACNGSKVTNSFAAAFDWANTTPAAFAPVLYYNYTFGLPDDGSDIGTKYMRKPQLLNMAVNSWLSARLGKEVSAELLGVSALPMKALKFSVDWTPVLGPLLATWILQLLLPVFVGQLVEEKEHRLRMMMKMHGLQDGAYWLVQYSWFLLLYVVYAAAFLLFGSVTQLALFTRSDYGIQVCLLFIWGNTLIAMSLLISCFFTSTRTATVFCYLYIFATGLVGYLMMRYLLDLGDFVPWVDALQVLPPLALYRGLYELGSYAKLGLQRGSSGMAPVNLHDHGNGMLGVWAMLAGEWAVMMMLAWYLEQVYASGTGNRRHPLYFLDCLRRSKHQQQQQEEEEPGQVDTAARGQAHSVASSDGKDSTLPVSYRASSGKGTGFMASNGFKAIFGRSSPVQILPIKTHVLHTLGFTEAKKFKLNLAPQPQLDAAAAAEGPLVEPADVAAERERAAAVDDFEQNPLVIRSLHKVYPAQDGQPPKLAVRRLDLAVAEGECFGLLGPNGAGKSTSISMLVGLQEPSSGTAIIGGHDITKGMRNIYSIMGLCPQHDLLWGTLSGREHLLFYGTLKGMAGAELSAAVESGLKAVRLWSNGMADKPSGSYSGGMKRRLSVAISLMGNPRVVYLDEPSTGLDPASRRVLWNVIKAAKPGRAIILTTHNMEEAEVLCDRLGIFVSGRLACIGHPKEITSRFCGFLLFTISVPAEREAEARALVAGMAPGAQLTYSVGGTLKYELPTEQVSLSRVFATMAGSSAVELGVIDWAVANATMEEVFIRIAQQMKLKATE